MGPAIAFACPYRQVAGRVLPASGFYLPVRRHIASIGPGQQAVKEWPLAYGRARPRRAVWRLYWDRAWYTPYEPNGVSGAALRPFRRRAAVYWHTLQVARRGA